MDPSAVELLILDVDGVLTSGAIRLSESGEQTKVFHTQDGSALKSWQRAGGRIALLSGRDCGPLRHRAEELNIQHLRLGKRDKLSGYHEILKETGCIDRTVAYMGDDIPDLGPMSQAGFPIAVANAVPAVKKAALYVTRKRGGEGAVSEVVELLLRKKGLWSRGVGKNV